MSKSRVPIKGEPNFTLISDEKLKWYIDLTQQLIFVYKHCDEEKARVASEILKQMSDENIKRLCESVKAELDRQEKEESCKPVVRKIKMVKRIKR